MIHLRAWKAEDAESLQKYANDPLIAKNMTNGFPHPYTKEHTANFIQMAMKSQPNNILAIDLNGEAIGGIGIHPQSDIHCMNAELGYWLAEKFWGKGYISAAIKLMTIYGFENFPISRIFARPFGTNIGSQKALEKAGFVMEARFEKTLLKNGELLDELIYAIRKA